MKRILLLGASGSIGKQTIDIIRENPYDLVLAGVSVGKNINYLRALLKMYRLDFVYSIDEVKDLKETYPYTRFYYGENGLEEIVKEEGYDLLVNALVGFVGFMPTLNAIYHRKDIALANKETLVGGGDLIKTALKETGVNLYPIDSEHSAIAQCLRGNNKDEVKRLIITASGGSLRNLKRKQLQDVTLDAVLNHPNWQMGAKITIDSATMMNKGFEIIEAHYLFDIPYENIDVILHDESIVHSMVEYKDGSIMAQLGTPDMRLPIKYALFYPEHRFDPNNNELDFNKINSLHFKKMDYERFPLCSLAKKLGNVGGNYGALLIGANDEAVKLFMNNKIKFSDIESLIVRALKEAKFIKRPTAIEIIESNKWAKTEVDILAGVSL